MASRTAVVVAVLALALSGCSDETDLRPRSDAAADEGVGDDASDAETPGSFELRIQRLSAPVTVRFDEAGVLHLTCQTDLDCYRVQGYFHAQHRFFAMDLIRRQTLGELSRIIGRPALEDDKKFRQFLTTTDGRPLEEVFYESVDDETRELFRAYTAGVNAWLEDWRNDENGATLTEEYEFPLIDKGGMRDWRPQDSVALFLQFAYQLGQKSEDDLFRGRLASELPAGAAADLVKSRPGLTSNIIQAAGAKPTEALAGGFAGDVRPERRMRRIRERLRPAGEALTSAHRTLSRESGFGLGFQSDGGSNSWAVAPRKTRGGKTLLANDPHLTLNNPSIWYYVELDSKTRGEGDLHVAGASIASVPGVVAGHNEDIAWSLTTARYDLADVYVEKLSDDGDAVLHDGERVELTRRDYTFDLPEGESETVTFEWVPGHGPLISKDPKNNRGVSVRWVAQEGGKDLAFLAPLMKAESIQEAQESLEKINVINASWVVASEEGEIGWYPETKLPKRPWASKHPHWLPLPGTGEAEWQGYVDRENLPELTNPPRGFIATANNDFDGSYTDGDTGNDGHTPWQSPPAYGHRHRRIVDLLARGAGDHTIGTMQAIQADTHSLHGEVLVPEILRAARQGGGELSAEAKDVRGALRDWGYECPTGLAGHDPDEAAPADDEALRREAIGCAAFHALLPQLTDAVFGDELTRHTEIEAEAYWYKFQASLLYLFRNPGKLRRGEVYFDDVTTGGTTETKARVVREALRKTAKELEKTFGTTDPAKWLWGRAHTVTLTSFFAQADIHDYDYGKFANDGGFGTVDVAPPRGREGDFVGGYSQRVGASLRMVFELGGGEVRARYQLPGGQDLHRESRWYNNLLGDWLDNVSRRLPFERAEVREAAIETFTVGPAP